MNEIFTLSVTEDNFALSPILMPPSYTSLFPGLYYEWKNNTTPLVLSTVLLFILTEQISLPFKIFL